MQGLNQRIYQEFKDQNSRILSQGKSYQAIKQLGEEKQPQDGRQYRHGDCRANRR